MPAVAGRSDTRDPDRGPYRSPPDRLLIVSDLHLSDGGPGENFHYDREFADWLDRLMEGSERSDRRFELVLNGDVFDFLRVVRLPATYGEVAEWRGLLEEAGVTYPRGALRRARAGDFSRRERRYGYSTREHESVWKLLRIVRAHPGVFRSLARWSRAGHAIVIIRGNHDLEWVWPGVRRAFAVLLRRAGSGTLDRRQLRFRLRTYRRANVLIEHGHCVHWFTHADRDFEAGSRLRLPYGSLISRYWFNVLERVVSLEAGVPASLALKRRIRTRPGQVWRPALASALRAIPMLGWRAWRAWLRRVARWWPSAVGGVVALSLLFLPELVPSATGWVPFRSVALRAGAGVLALLLPQVGFAAREIAGQVSGNHCQAARRYARRIAHRCRHVAGLPRYVVLGHTHRPDLLRWVEDGDRIVYANPGTWMPAEQGRDRSPQARFVWLARRGDGYARQGLLSCDTDTKRCVLHSIA